MMQAVIHAMKHHDTHLVELAIAAMGTDVDLATETEITAAVFLFAPGNGQLPGPECGWIPTLMQPYRIESVSTSPIKEQARIFQLDRDFLEDPAKRWERLRHGDHAKLNISMVFEPTEIFFTKNVPRSQLWVWKMSQDKEKETHNPPRIHFLRHVSNGYINSNLKLEHEMADLKTRKGIFYPVPSS
jgi:hypothetical protein